MTQTGDHSAPQTWPLPGPDPLPQIPAGIQDPPHFQRRSWHADRSLGFRQGSTGDVGCERSKNLPHHKVSPKLGTQRCSSPIQCMSSHPGCGCGTVVPCLNQPVKSSLSLRPWRRARNLLLVSSPKATLPAPAPHPFWVTFLLPKIPLCSSCAAERDSCPRESTPLPSLAPHTGNMDSRAQECKHSESEQKQSC